MPLEGEPLSEAEVALLKRWIDQGAKAPDEAPPADPRKHWSYQPPVRPNVPTVADASLSNHPVDAFLEVEREKHGLRAQPAADKNVLLRRVYLDLIGLPPTREQIRAFKADDQPNAYERVVDELLASPQYGERWGRHWMDIWRYSDWAGFGDQIRDSQHHIWHWRDWIVRSLNADKSYARMIEEMLAGDELAPTDQEVLAATGYLARNWHRFNRNTWLDNTVEHTGKAFLAMTLNCARCHDHKFDPIEQTDFYRFRAFFEPYDVRMDQVPGQADADKDGIPRVYDAKADSPTYLFVRGNEKQPDKEHPLAPGAPTVVCGKPLEIHPVELPPTAYNPGLQAFIQQQSLATARTEIEQAKAALAKAHTDAAAAHTQLAALASPVAAATAGENPKQPKSDSGKAQGGDKKAPPPTYASAKQTLEQADVAVAAAEKGVEAAQAELASFEARVAADNARFAAPPAANAQELALAASKAHRKAAVCLAEKALIAAQQKLSAARANSNADAAKTKEAIEAADKSVAEARKNLEAARADMAKSTADYPPLRQTFPSTSTGRRVALARWIANRENPRTARVAVNHIWMRHFGQPLVRTVFEFGVAGQPPSHPQLLDWLAVEFMDSGWSMKHLHRLLVTSHAYRMQSSGGDDANRSIDPDNRYLWRANVRRMEAEVVRDSLLHVAGQLDLTMGGPDLDQQSGLTVPRRSIYFRHASEKQMTLLVLFDAASVSECYRRGESIAPQQALALVNSPLALAEARTLAGRLWKEVEAGATSDANRDEAFVRAAFEQVLCRRASRRRVRRVPCISLRTGGRAGESWPLEPIRFDREECRGAGRRSAAKGPREPGPRAVES